MGEVLAWPAGEQEAGLAGFKVLAIARVEVPHTHGRLTEVTLGDDVVAFEHRAGLVAGDHHGNAFGNTGPDHVPDGRPPEIMEEHPGHAGLPAGGLPGGQEAQDLPAAAVEDPGNNDAL